MVSQLQGPVLTVVPDTPDGQAVLKALASTKRVAILQLLASHPKNVSEIADALGMPMSTANLHITALEQAHLLLTELRPGERGLQKICARAYSTILIQFPMLAPDDMQTIEMSMPIGAFVDCDITPTCGLASEEVIIGMLDDPSSFYEPERASAQLLWFHKGYVEYRYPKRFMSHALLGSLQVSFEACSEAPMHHEDWPSDITLWINEVEIGTWTSPADFGGERAVLTPTWWQTNNTQHGLLKIWQVHNEGSYVDGQQVSGVCLDDLDLHDREYISVRIGVKSDAKHVGGINLFGKKFGNYPQDIVLNIRYF